MRVPEKLHILFKEYTVKYGENIRDSNGNMLFGEIDYIVQTITLNSVASAEQTKSTLIHEVVHGLDELFGIGLKEKQVEKLGVALYMFIRDNPGIFKEDA